LLRLRKKAGIQRRKISRCRIAMRILHGVAAQDETEFSSAIGLPSGVDRSSTGRKKLSSSGRSNIDNGQGHRLRTGSGSGRGDRLAASCRSRWRHGRDHVWIRG
jgi:hypothetical protein